MTHAFKARTQAAKLNPIISLVNSSDTLSNCVTLITEMGYALANTDTTEEHRHCYLLTGAIAAALNFEREALHV